MRSPDRWSLCLAALLAGCLTALPMSATASPRGKATTAAPRSIDDCERYKEALAYNACLASFGPERRGGGALVSQEVSSDGDGKAETSGRRAESRYGKRSNRYSRSSRYQRNRHGRASATFSVPDSIISGNSLGRR